jgi:hypothetical protein
MNFLRKTASAFGALLFAALLIAALAPKAAHGVVATLVQVANTATNPVPNRDIDNGPRQGVTLSAQAAGNNINFLPLFDVADPFNTAPYTVPAGKRLLVQFISGRFQTPAGAHILDASIDGAVRAHPGAANGLLPINEVLAPQLITAGNFNIYQVSQPLWLFEDAGATPSLNVALTSGSFSTNGFFFVRGYLADCTDSCP